MLSTSYPDFGVGWQNQSFQRHDLRLQEYQPISPTTYCFFSCASFRLRLTKRRSCSLVHFGVFS
jgi:hypothetical protein